MRKKDGSVEQAAYSQHEIKMDPIYFQYAPTLFLKKIHLFIKYNDH